MSRENFTVLKNREEFIVIIRRMLGHAYDPPFPYHSYKGTGADFVGLRSIKERVPESGRSQYAGQLLKRSYMGRVSRTMLDRILGGPPLPICVLNEYTCLEQFDFE
ncbi:hypothetical protein BHYA_0210g00180 [Botrytis hyacinthi]|uniref:Uncharacterized protein n=1 Tax=Botrytis hyacinthi TaxID=278943 RepID=A0A4Z1GI64_9HELO|nr:hypothetical protein BHYA_0210g00180 [Botrytis hyacinthi]